MAQKPLSVFSFFLVFNILLSSSFLVVQAGRNIPTNVDVKHPEFYFNHDRGFLIPGVGRVIKPHVGDHVNPITYNPVTGNNGGYHGYFTPLYGGPPIPIGGGGAGGDDNFPSTGGTATPTSPIGGGSGTGTIPGGDDTFPSTGGTATPTSPIGGGSGTGTIPGGDDTFPSTGGTAIPTSPIGGGGGGGIGNIPGGDDTFPSTGGTASPVGGGAGNP